MSRVLPVPEMTVSLSMGGTPATAGSVKAAEASLSPAEKSAREKNRLAETFAQELQSLRAETVAEAVADAQAEIEQAVAREKATFELVYAQKQRELAEREAALLGRVDILMTALTQEKSLLDERMEKMALEIAMTGLSAILADSTAYAERLQAALAKALHATAGPGLTHIRVSAADHALLVSAETLSKWSSLWCVDDTLSPGQCVLQFGPRHVDIGLAQQFESLCKVLANTFAARNDHVLG